ncbi:MAG TPA: Dam family site-specific DNA-(adenine-N6)-methyltransferase [Vicinamibacterales bacterium]|jgi:DNA adenine methylase
MTRKIATDAARDGVKPILKWAGGKRQLLPRLRRYYPRSFDRYVEPFLGSGAVFLDCHNHGLLESREVRLSDINADVIGCYRMVRDSVDEVIDALEALDAGHRQDGPRHFYSVRDDQFNSLRRSVHAAENPAERYTPALAAMLIYLNRTGYNGLFRVNSRGAFNVPAGRYSSVTICDAPNLRRLARALRRPGLTLDVRGFELALAGAGAGDFVYLDPPYAPVSRTSHFTSYTAGRFGPEEQARLQRAVVTLAQNGAAVLLSNSVAPDIRRLYAEDTAARSAGLRTTTVPARRAINSRASRRGAVREYLITNIV